jgi:hypothetical protein
MSPKELPDIRALRSVSDFLDYFEARSQTPIDTCRGLYRDVSECDRPQDGLTPDRFTPRRLQGWSR